MYSQFGGHCPEKENKTLNFKYLLFIFVWTNEWEIKVKWNKNQLLSSIEICSYNIIIRFVGYFYRTNRHPQANKWCYRAIILYYHKYAYLHKRHKTRWIEYTACVLCKNWKVLSHYTESYWVTVLFIYNIHFILHIKYETT